MNMSPQPLMKIVEDGFGDNFNTPDRDRYGKLTCYEVADDHSINGPYDPP